MATQTTNDNHERDRTRSACAKWRITRKSIDFPPHLKFFILCYSLKLSVLVSHSVHENLEEMSLHHTRMLRTRCRHSLIIPSSLQPLFTACIFQNLAIAYHSADLIHPAPPLLLNNPSTRYSRRVLSPLGSSLIHFTIADTPFLPSLISFKIAARADYILLIQNPCEFLLPHCPLHSASIGLFHIASPVRSS
ncbi:hypothetical protein C8R45DRAFT_1109130 [Mycena sanguinolenta]|nr:hypothetical protein C8R45DRAFT_1109130 [Mycena sanguinolenta]